VSTYIGDEMSPDSSLEEVLVGREVVSVEDHWDSEEVTLILDDGTALEIDASLGCCAYGVVNLENVVGGSIMSVSTDMPDDPDSEADSVYRIFLMKNGLPDGTITVESYESSGYYGTGYTLRVRKPGDSK
jgi:hypothetical protein